MVVALNTNCQLVIPAIGVSATDNCTPLCDLVYTQSPPAGTIVSGTNAYVTVTVTDLCGNSSQCTVHVEGVNRRGLVVSWPPIYDRDQLSGALCVELCESHGLQLPDISLHFTQSPPCNTPIGPGINSITVTVTDCNGATATKVIPLNMIGDESFLNVLTNTGISATGTLLPPERD